MVLLGGGQTCNTEMEEEKNGVAMHAHIDREFVTMCDTNHKAIVGIELVFSTVVATTYVTFVAKCVTLNEIRGISGVL